MIRYPICVERTADTDKLQSINIVSHLAEVVVKLAALGLTVRATNGDLHASNTVFRAMASATAATVPDSCAEDADMGDTTTQPDGTAGVLPEGWGFHRAGELTDVDQSHTIHLARLPLQLSLGGLSLPDPGPAAHAAAPAGDGAGDGGGGGVGGGGGGGGGADPPAAVPTVVKVKIGDRLNLVAATKEKAGSRFKLVPAEASANVGGDNVQATPIARISSKCNNSKYLPVLRAMYDLPVSLVVHATSAATVSNAPPAGNSRSAPTLGVHVDVYADANDELLVSALSVRTSLYRDGMLCPSRR